MNVLLGLLFVDGLIVQRVFFAQPIWAFLQALESPQTRTLLRLFWRDHDGLGCRHRRHISASFFPGPGCAILTCSKELFGVLLALGITRAQAGKHSLSYVSGIVVDILRHVTCVLLMENVEC